MTTAAIEAPTHLNGYPIIHAVPDRGGFMVMAYRDGHPVHRFVVSYWFPHCGDEWMYGVYAATLPDAMRLFPEARP